LPSSWAIALSKFAGARAAAIALGNLFGLVADLIVAFALDGLSEFGIAFLDDPAINHNVHGVRFDVLQNARIVRDDEEVGFLAFFALTQRIDRMIIGSAVTCPTFRNNPAVVAQAFATLSQLAPGRVFLGVGTGEALNEVPTGGGWGRYAERAERLVEAITIIRAL